MLHCINTAVERRRSWWCIAGSSSVEQLIWHTFGGVCVTILKGIRIFFLVSLLPSIRAVHVYFSLGRAVGVCDFDGGVVFISLSSEHSQGYTALYPCLFSFTVISCKESNRISSHQTPNTKQATFDTLLSPLGPKPPKSKLYCG